MNPTKPIDSAMEIEKFHHEYEELHTEITELLLQNEKRKPRIIGALTASGAIVEKLLVYIIKREGRESQLQGKQPGINEYKKLILDVLPKEQGIHIGTITQWRNHVAHGNNIDKVHTNELGAVSSALKSLITWFFEDYLREENIATDFIKNNSILIEEEIRDENLTEEIKPEALRDETDNIVLEKKRRFPVTLVLGIICGGLICVFLLYLVQSKMGVTGNSEENRLNRDSVNNFLERYFNSLNDKKSNADQFFADHVDQFYKYKNQNPTQVDVLRQLNTEYIDNKHLIDKGTLLLYKDSAGVSYWRFWNDFVCYRTSKRKFQSGKVQMEFGINNENKITSIKEIFIQKPTFSKNKP